MCSCSTRVREAGFGAVRLVPVEGFAALLSDLPGRMAEPSALLRVIRLTKPEESLLGVSPHIIAVARRPGVANHRQA
jgi:hypothetical protein